MKRAGKIGRWGRAAVVAALGVGLALLAIPVANADSSWEFNQDRPTTTQTVTKIKKPVSTFQSDWE